MEVYLVQINLIFSIFFRILFSHFIYLIGGRTSLLHDLATLLNSIFFRTFLFKLIQFIQKTFLNIFQFDIIVLVLLSLILRLLELVIDWIELFWICILVLDFSQLACTFMWWSRPVAIIGGKCMSLNEEFTFDIILGILAVIQLWDNIGVLWMAWSVWKLGWIKVLVHLHFAHVEILIHRGLDQGDLFVTRSHLGIDHVEAAAVRLLTRRYNVDVLLCILILLTWRLGILLLAGQIAGSVWIRAHIHVSMVELHVLQFYLSQGILRLWIYIVEHSGFLAVCNHGACVFLGCLLLEKREIIQAFLTELILAHFREALIDLKWYRITRPWVLDFHPFFIRIPGNSVARPLLHRSRSLWLQIRMSLILY